MYLLHVQRTINVPTCTYMYMYIRLLACLPATPEVCIGHHAPKVLHEHDASGTEGGLDGNVEPSVAVQNGRVAAVQGDSLLLQSVK